MSQIKKSLTTQGIEYRNSGNNQAAIECFLAHIAKMPNDITSMHNLAAAYGDIGQHNKAIEVLDAAFQKGLNAPQSWLVYARSATAEKQFEDAKKAYLAVINLTPFDLDAQREFAQLKWMLSGDITKALTTLNSTLEIHPEAIGLHVLRAEITVQMNEFERGYELIIQSFKLTNENSQLFYYVSKIALKTERLSHALDYAQKAYALFPNIIDISINLINCLLAKGDATQALEIIEANQDKHPNNQHLIALLGTAWRLLGDERYEALFNYNMLVHQFEIQAPEQWPSLDTYLDDLERELDSEHQFVNHPFFLSVRHGSQIPSIHLSSNPAMRAFPDAIAASVNRYIAKLKQTNSLLNERNSGQYNLLSAWSVCLPPNGYHVNHVHQQGWLSSACHIREPSPDPNAPRAGWLKLGEPGPKTTPPLQAEHFIEPKRGYITIFPSYMWHGTIAFKLGPSRLVVAADLLPK